MRPEKPARGPAPAYSRERIAEVAIALADAEGIEAVSMRRIATVLGTGAMTLYRYLPTKEDLYSVMVDQAIGFEPQPPTGDVRTDLSVLADRYRQTLHRHPWLAAAISGRPLMGPNMLRGNERDLALIDGYGLSLGQMISVLTLIRTWVNGRVQAELADREAARRSGLDREAWQRRMGPYVTTLLATDDFPYLRRLIEEVEPRDDDEQFEDGMAMLLDGIASRHLGLH